MKPNNIIIFDPDALSAALGQSSPEVLTSFYEIFLRHTRSGWRSILQAAAKSQWENVAITSHSLKSSCASVGAYELSTRLQQLELSARDMETSELILTVEEISEIVELTLAEISGHVMSLNSDMVS